MNMFPARPITNTLATKKEEKYSIELPLDDEKYIVTITKKNSSQISLKCENKLNFLSLYNYRITLTYDEFTKIGKSFRLFDNIDEIFNIIKNLFIGVDFSLKKQTNIPIYQTRIQNNNMMNMNNNMPSLNNMNNNMIGTNNNIMSLNNMNNNMMKANNNIKNMNMNNMMKANNNIMNMNNNNMNNNNIMNNNMNNNNNNMSGCCLANNNNMMNINNNNMMMISFQIYFRHDSPYANLGEIVSVQCYPDDKISSVIEKYRIQSGDYDQNKIFKFNDNVLSPNLTVSQAGITNFNNNIVVSIGTQISSNIKIEHSMNNSINLVLTIPLLNVKQETIKIEFKKENIDLKSQYQKLKQKYLNIMKIVFPDGNYDNNGIMQNNNNMVNMNNNNNMMMNMNNNNMVINRNSSNMMNMNKNNKNVGVSNMNNNNMNNMNNNNMMSMNNNNMMNMNNNNMMNMNNNNMMNMNNNNMVINNMNSSEEILKKIKKELQSN